MQKRRLLNRSELEVDTVLQRQLRDSGYSVFSKVRLADVINKERGEFLPQRDFDYLRGAHLDFVVSRNEIPVFAVEFDGPLHETDDQTEERDILKNRLCRAAGLPLLRITSTALEYHDQLTLLDYMLMRFIAWKREWPDLQREMAERAEEYGDTRDPEDLAVELDPSFWFDVRHPYPGLEGIKERLWRTHRVASFLDSDARQSSAAFLCESHAGGGGPLHHEQFHTSVARVSVWLPNESRETPVFLDFVEVTVRAWLPVESSSMPEPAVYQTPEIRELTSYLESMGAHVRSIWFPELPGLSPWDIADNYAEYLGYRRIELWASEQSRSGV